MIISDLGHFEVISEAPDITGGSFVDLGKNLIKKFPDYSRYIKKITAYSKTIKTRYGTIKVYAAFGTTKDGRSFSIASSSSSSG